MLKLISGFPKSGTTWFCRILDDLLKKDYNISQQISPDIKRIYRHKKENNKIVFSYLNNPLYFLQQSIIEDNQSVIIYRNFKNILVSCYFQQTYREALCYDGSIDNFIDFDYGGINSIINFYNFIESNSQHKSYVYYENMYESLISLSVINQYSVSDIIESYNNNTFEKMRKQETENYYNPETSSADKIELCPKDINNINSFKTRCGPNSNYSDYLNVEQIERIDNIIRDRFLFLEKHPGVI